jgi:putative aldouronate transport system substrate-binding protein
MKGKKLVLILLVIMAVALLSACRRDGDGAATGVEPAAGQQTTLSPDQPVTWNMMIVTDSMMPADDNVILAAIRERLGVTLVFDLVPGDMQDTRVATLLAAGATLPDFIGVTQLDAHMAAGGALLRLDPFLDSGQWPRLYEHHAPYRGRLTFRPTEEAHIDEDGIYQLAVWCCM